MRREIIIFSPKPNIRASRRNVRISQSHEVQNQIKRKENTSRENKSHSSPNSPEIKLPLTFLAGFSIFATAFSTLASTFFTTLDFFTAAFAFVTPVGLLAFVAVFGARLAVVFAFGLVAVRFLGAGTTGSTAKTRGREFPVAARVSRAISYLFWIGIVRRGNQGDLEQMERNVWCVVE
jgi:hypothetical protein